MAGCGQCAKAKAARMAAAQAKGKSAGKWSLTFSDGGRQGERYFFDNKLAAMAANLDLGGGGLIRAVN